ncbi:MAG: polysaccharide biosynthesis protein [Bacteroidales bacterium]|nr:polysaccharide biosynthesis protein [Bacteroidales bacterium]
MIRSLIKTYAGRFLSRWIILSFDLAITAVAFLFAYLIRYNFSYEESINLYHIEIQLVLSTLVYMVGYLIFGSYNGIVRHTGVMDALKIFKSTTASFVLLLLFSIALHASDTYVFLRTSYGILVIHYLLVMFLLSGSRIFIRLVYTHYFKQNGKRKIRVVIYGAGAAGLITKNVLLKDPVYYYDVVAFIDDNPFKIKKTLEGIPVLSPKQALQKKYIKSHSISQMIIAIQVMNPQRRKEVVEKGLDLQLEVKVVPSIDLWINGQLSSQQLRRVKIEELLEREPIQLDNKNVERELKNKVVLITGAAGSIGSEIVRQVLNYEPARVILIDQAESALYDLQFELKSTPNFQQVFLRMEFVVASVKDRLRMERLIELYKPNVIYHAAAYKHVPLMEAHPYEALLANVFGTKVMADLAVKHKVEKFVMISTDKAVNPTNIMGASKRIAEIYIQSVANGGTKFVTTRFGNVLGSNGSVVPLFRKQIENKGPVTVTHKDITRYFMTIPEACNLVLEAGAMGKGSDIFVFDMGEPVRIYDMARKMIQLYGFQPDRDIEIVEVGLRPGEKLYEELLNNKENTLPTHHPKIMRARVRKVAPDVLERLINELSAQIIEHDDFALVSKMKQIVPEYVSNNSVFESLDKKLN